MPVPCLIDKANNRRESLRLQEGPDETAGPYPLVWRLPWWFDCRDQRSTRLSR
jgi:hypothetical protein